MSWYASKLYNKSFVNRPFYSCVHTCTRSYQAHELAWGQRSLCFNRDLAAFTQRKQWGLYQNKVTSSLAAIQKPGHRTDNFKIVYSYRLYIYEHSYLMPRTRPYKEVNIFIFLFLTYSDSQLFFQFTTVTFVPQVSWQWQHHIEKVLQFSVFHVIL